MNIEESIIEYGTKVGLEPVSTGGGHDYMCREIVAHSLPDYDLEGSKTVLVLASKEAFENSPTSLDDEECTVGVYHNDEDWSDGVYFFFPNAKLAMAFMTSVTEMFWPEREAVEQS